jgi:hypothetical protein
VDIGADAGSVNGWHRAQHLRAGLVGHFRQRYASGIVDAGQIDLVIGCQTNVAPPPR